MESLSKRVNVRLVNDAANCIKCVNKASFVSRKIFRYLANNLLLFMKLNQF